MTFFDLNIFRKIQNTSGLSILATVLMICLSSALRGQQPTVSEDFHNSNIIKEGSNSLWEIESARIALRQGLPSIAEGIFRRLINDPANKNAPWFSDATLEWSKSLLALERFEEANDILNDYTGRTTSEYYLCDALITSARRRFPEAEYMLNNVKPEELSKESLGWYYFLQGILLEQNGQPDEADAAFKHASQSAVSDSQRAEFELNLLRSRLSKSPLDDQAFTALSDKVKETSVNSRLGRNYRLQYAISLFNRGQKAEAISFLSTALQSIPDTDRDWSSWILQLAYFEGVNTEKGKALLKRLIFLSNQSEIRLKALFSFIKNADKTEITALTEELIPKLGNDTQHLELLYSILYFYAQTGEFEIRNQDIRNIIDSPQNPFEKRFPESRLKTNTYTLLAYISYKRNPPEYRTAANYLIKFIAKTDNEQDRELAKIMVADCYYKNGDFENAARFCQEAISETSEIKTRGNLFLQESVALLSINQSEALVKRIQEIHASDSTVIPADTYWQIEWNLLQYYRKNDQIDTAIAHIKELRDELVKSHPLIKIRFLWLITVFQMSEGQYEAALSAVKFLENELRPIPKEENHIYVLALDANTMLLHSEILFVLSKQSQEENKEHSDALADEALDISKQLRTKYPNYDSAIYSLFIESRYYASINRLVDSQKSLIELADNYPKSEFAPLALYEAAINAEQRKITEAYRDALLLIERLVTNYPNSKILFSAFLLQGDIFREMNEFDKAQQTYENLLVKFPNNPLCPVAELYVADCIFAKASKNPSFYENAAIAYERLFDKATLSSELRIEAGYKWGNALAQNKKPNRAQEVYWMVIQTFLDQNTNLDKLQANGKLWLARCIFSLGELLEQAKKIEESNIVYKKILDYNLPGTKNAKTKLKLD